MNKLALIPEEGGAEGGEYFFSITLVFHQRHQKKGGGGNCLWCVYNEIKIVNSGLGTPHPPAQGFDFFWLRL